MLLCMLFGGSIYLNRFIVNLYITLFLSLIQFNTAGASISFDASNFFVDEGERYLNLEIIASNGLLNRAVSIMVTVSEGNAHGQTPQPDNDNVKSFIDL